MTETERRGLDIACDVLADSAGRTQREQCEIDAAIEWIRRQQAIDTRRRQPRGQYKL